MKILLELDDFDRDEVIEKVTEKFYEQITDEDVAERAARYLSGPDALNAVAVEFAHYGGFMEEVANHIDLRALAEKVKELQ